MPAWADVRRRLVDGGLDLLRGRLGDLLRRPVVGLEPLAGAGGYTPALRLIAELDHGRTCFVKAAVDEQTTDGIRAEHRA